MYSLCCYVARSNDTVQQFNIAKWTYCCCFSIVAVITWLLRDYADDFFVNHVSSFSYCKDPQYQQLCTGKQVAQRFSFANFVFFATHAVLLFGLKREDDPRAGLHISMWFWKLAAWAGTIVGFFFVPVDAVLIYTQIARVGSGLFLIFQVIELINFVYVINEYLTEREQCWSWTVLVLGSGLCFCGGLALLGVCYHFYAPSPSCSLNIFFITWTIIMMLAMVMVLFVPDRARSAGLLTSGAVFAYCAYLTLSSLSSEPKSDSCVRLGGTSSGWIQIVAFVLALLSLSYSTASIGSADLWGGSGTDSSSEEVPYRADFFHFIYALGSMYLAMLLTSWEVSSSGQQFTLDTGWTSTWVKMGSKWLCELLYVWSVVAPSLLTGREFS